MRAENHIANGRLSVPLDVRTLISLCWSAVADHICAFEVSLGLIMLNLKMVSASFVLN